MPNRRRFLAGFVAGGALLALGIAPPHPARPHAPPLVTDSTDWLQAQLDHGGVVAPPAGVYHIARTLRVGSGTWLSGDKGVVLRYHGTGPCIQCDRHAMGITGMTIIITSASAVGLAAQVA